MNQRIDTLRDRAIAFAVSIGLTTAVFGLLDSVTVQRDWSLAFVLFLSGYLFTRLVLMYRVMNRMRAAGAEAHAGDRPDA